MNVEAVEDIYVMTPLQQGLLFHGLMAPQSGLYAEQFVWDLRGDLRLKALESAWQQVANRHAILRTSFHWEDLGKPLQVVHREMPLTVKVCDWRGHSVAVQEELLAAYLSEDRQRGFDLAEVPLLRLTVAQVADDAYKFIWSFHHIILDGWSSSIVQAEVFALYEALSQGAELALAPVIPFSSYIAWLRRQDLAAAEVFWRRKLQGFTSPVALSFGQPAAPAQPDAPDRMDRELNLSPELTASLQSLGRRHHLTLNTLLLGAWGLLISRYTGRQDIVVGVTVSGRPETIHGVESIVGNFINTLPARLHVSADPLVSWLRQLQAAQLELHSYEYTPLADIQKWSDVAVGQP
ncbi:MAG: condensation domain-containing protein, partial [Acidobacteriota bacterium]